MRGRYRSKWGTHGGLVNVILWVDESVESGGRRMKAGQRKDLRILIVESCCEQRTANDLQM